MESFQPVFHLGQIVIVHRIPFEFPCPQCHVVCFNDGQPHEDIRAKITDPAPAGMMRCTLCGCQVPIPEGWVELEKIDVFAGDVSVLPYTLLEPAA